MNIYDLLYEPIKLKPPIKMFEAFSGIGTQHMALKRITKDYEIVGISEIDEPAIKSYRAIHGNNIESYGDITKMKEIPLCDIFTWSFPCTDISKAGERKGMTKDTRSGLVYDVLRLLESTTNKPKVLIMENVTDLIQNLYYKKFRKIRLELEHMGYIHYVETLNAMNYGIPQNRNRVFMVSVLGDYSYAFPNHVKLLKSKYDYLELEVDQRYYLTPQLWKAFTSLGSSKYPRKDRFFQNLNRKNQNIANTITCTGFRPTDNFIKTKHGTRRITPREAWRLMGISDEDFDKAQAVNSSSQLYKQAGNAIVVDVFEAILREMIEL